MTCHENAPTNSEMYARTADVCTAAFHTGQLQILNHCEAVIIYGCRVQWCIHAIASMTVQVFLTEIL